MAVLLFVSFVLRAADTLSQLAPKEAHAGAEETLPGHLDVDRLMHDQQHLSQQFEAVLKQWQEDKREWQKMAKEWEVMKMEWEQERKALQSEKENCKQAVGAMRDMLRTFCPAFWKFKEMQTDLIGNELNSHESSTSKGFQTSPQVQTEHSNVQNVGSVSVAQSQAMLENDVPIDHEMASRSDGADPLESVVNKHSQRLSGIDAQIQALENSVENTHTSIYTDWGRSSCPNTSQLVYSGVVGGSFYKTSSAAPNYLCLPLNPVLSSHSIPSRYANLYGAEYETCDSHDDSDPVCAVCRSPRPTTIMIPSTNVCNPGWTLEYTGYLMANDHGYAASYEYVCADTEF